MKLDTVHADLLAAAAEWRLLALALRRPTTARAQEVASLAAEVADAELRDAALAAVGSDAATYLLVLGPGSAISPRLVAYRGTEDPGWILADVMRYYDAFAFHPRVEDPPDHVTVAADFVAYLYLKEAFARADGRDEAAELTRAARERFVREHLAAEHAPQRSVTRPTRDRAPQPKRSAPRSARRDSGNAVAELHDGAADSSPQP